MLDWQASQLMSFAPDGALRFRVGREGQGPGEFDEAYTMAWDGGESLFVVNGGATRIDHWTTSGEFRRSVALSELGLSRAYGLEAVGSNRLLLSLPDRTTIATEYITVTSGEQWRVEGRFRVDNEPVIEMPIFMVFPLPVTIQQDSLSVGSLDRTC